MDDGRKEDQTRPLWGRAGRKKKKKREYVRNHNSWSVNDEW